MDEVSKFDSHGGKGKTRCFEIIKLCCLQNIDRVGLLLLRGTNRSKCTKYLHSFHFISREIREIPFKIFILSPVDVGLFKFSNFPLNYFFHFHSMMKANNFVLKKIYSKPLLYRCYLLFPSLKSSPLWMRKYRNDDHSFVNIFIESDLVVIVAPISKRTQTMIHQIILITRREARRMERTKSISGYWKIVWGFNPPLLLGRPLARCIRRN